MKNTATLLICCPDRKGLVAAIANFLYTYNANILHADQHQDAAEGLFLMRVEWDLADFTLSIDAFGAAFQPIAERFGMQWKLALSANRPKMAIFVSKYDHCLVDLLYRHQSGELACDIPLIISNHDDTRRLAELVPNVQIGSGALGGGHALHRQLCEKFGLDASKHGIQTTPDGRFSVEFVECLASCGTAPVMMVNEKFHQGVTPAKADEIVGGCR